MKKIYLVFCEVTSLAFPDRKSYQVFIVNQKSEKRIKEQIQKRYEIEPFQVLKILNVIASDKDGEKMMLVLSKFNLFWGSKLFDKNGEESYRIRYLDHLLTLVYFSGLKHMHEVMKKIKTTSP